MKKSETDKKFYDWLYGAKFYHGTPRYGQFPGNHVFASRYNSDDNLMELLDTLEDSDIPAIEAAKKLQELKDQNEIWMEYDDDPAFAMWKLRESMRKFWESP